MKNKRSVKLSEDGIKFLDKAAINFIKADKEEKIITYSDTFDRIVKYFKLHNDSYIEYINMEYQNGIK